MAEFLSIIIPVYNAENYLAECLDSCLNQDIPAGDYEIICVNDGSTDGSGAILERYAREHSNIRVITQPNGGISIARNTGLDAAQGEYIWFVDSDDFIRKNCLNELRQVVTDKPVDKLTIYYYEFENALSSQEQEQANTGTLPPSSASLETVVWDSLYSLTFLRRYNLRFRPELRFAEDRIFNHSFNRCSPVTGDYHALLYYYRRNPSSLTRTITPDALRRRSEAYYMASLQLVDYAQLDLNMLQEAQADHDEYIRILMPLVREIAIFSAPLLAEHRREILKKLSDAELFPLFLYRGFRNHFPQKCHMNHAHMGLKGKIVDVLNFYSTTRLGFAALVLYYKLYYKLKRKANA